MSQKEQLSDDYISDVIIDRGAQEDDAILQQPRVDVKGALATICAFDDSGNEILDGRNAHGCDNSTLGTIGNEPQGVAGDVRGIESSRPSHPDRSQRTPPPNQDQEH